MVKRVILRTAAAMALIIGSVALASPAQAHPTVSGPHCDVGAGFVGCVIGVSGAVPPVDVDWFINGIHIRECDNRYHCSGTCVIGTRVGIKVVVTDASRVPVTASTSKFCGPIIP